jgi:hypothetical protein
MKGIYAAALALGCLALTSFTIPKGWQKAGSDPGSYAVGVEPGAGLSGSKAGTIQSSRDRITGYGMMEQTLRAGTYRGTKLRVSGYMRSQDVAQWAGFFVRIDGQPGYKALAFDNMQDRPIKGTTGWAGYEITLNVSEEAKNIVFGALLDGPGKIWFDNITLEVINEPTSPRGTILYRQAVNLNFEQ